MSATCKTLTRALRDESDKARTPDSGHIEPEKHDEPDVTESGGVLVCRACRSRITRRELGMEVNGSYRHVFFNPSGDVFELGCFASAKNTIPTGPKTDEFTWFPGFQWQVVSCTGCATQLGWRYTGKGGGFFGLILSTLMEELGGKP